MRIERASPPGWVSVRKRDRKQRADRGRNGGGQFIVFTREKWKRPKVPLSRRHGILDSDMITWRRSASHPADLSRPSSGDGRQSGLAFCFRLLVTG